MHPRDVDRLYPDEYAAMIDYAISEQRAEQRAIRDAKRKAR
jgi:hypothetical protein